jgi:sarcosine oxidase gamma subunit
LKSAAREALSLRLKDVAAVGEPVEGRSRAGDDDRAVVQVSPDELPVIDIHAR